MLFRDGAAPEMLDKFMSDMEVDLPMAPGLGLVLLECHFDIYQKHRGAKRDPLTFLDCLEAQQKFRESVIDHAIYETDLAL